MPHIQSMPGHATAVSLKFTRLIIPFMTWSVLGFIACHRVMRIFYLWTGVVTRHMQTALLRTYDATPNPKWGIAMGDCASCGGEFGTSYALCGAVSNVIPVDMTISGCPPTPLVLLKSLLSVMEK